MTKINYQIVSIMLGTLSKYADLLQDGYAIAIYTVEDKMYTYIVEKNTKDEHERIYSDIRSNLKDSILYIVCVRGKKMTIDIPPYHLRKKICEINKKNYEAKIITQGMNEYNLKKMRDTLL